jgi:hypothetical protein
LGKIVVRGALVALLAFGLSCAPTAYADENSFVWNLENDPSAYFYGNSAGLIDLGYRICYDLSLGNTIAQETSVVLTNPYFDFNLPAARGIVLHAEQNLC